MMRTTRQAVPAALDKILSLDPQRLALRATNARDESKLLCPATCEALIQSAWDLRYVDAEASLRAATRAHQIASQQPRCRPLLARAAAELGNALRRVGRFGDAATALEEAERSADANDSALRGKIASYLGTLYQSQRLWSAAHAALDRAQIFFDRIPDSAGVARVAVQRGIAFIYQGQPGEAVPTLTTALSKIESDEDLARMALQPLLVALIEVGRVDDAHRLFVRVEPLLAGGDRLYQVKILWLRGRMYAALGSAETARYLFDQVRAVYREEEMVPEAALATLELASLEAEQRHHARVLTLAAELETLFSGLGLAPESCAVGLLRRAAAEPLCAASALRDAERIVRLLPSYRRTR